MSRSVLTALVMAFSLSGTLGCTANSENLHTSPSLESQSSPGTTAFAFTEADLAAYEKGLAAETALVLAARGRGDDAKTPEARAAAAQDEWEEQTIPGGAQAAGLSVDRYRKVRETVNRALETLDFQGQINGPLEIDSDHATPEMKQRLAGDPFSELSPASAAALRRRMSTLVPVWVRYMELVAVNG